MAKSEDGIRFIADADFSIGDFQQFAHDNIVALRDKVSILKTQIASARSELQEWNSALNCVKRFNRR